MDGLRLVEPRAYAEQGYPHAEWKALRTLPLTHFEPPGWQSFWAITKHADVIEVSKQPVARKTTGSLLRELLPRLEHVELAGTPQRTASNLVPGLKYLPIRYRIRPAARA
jgi:cytochrome P450